MSDGKLGPAGADDPAASLRRARMRAHEMGNPEKLARLHAEGKLDARARISGFVDPDSLWELGTFVASEDPSTRDATPGDGLIGGHALCDGRPVTVAADDVTVKRATSAPGNQARLRRLYEAAQRRGNPFVFFGERGGARIPDALGSFGFTRIADPDGVAPHLSRRRRIPMACAIVGESFGQSSLLAAASDFVVQLRGAAFGLTSPRVVEAATGAAVDVEELAGAEVSLRRTGSIDAIAEDDEDVARRLRAFLSYLPSHAEERPPMRAAQDAVGSPGAVAGLVPTYRRRGYDMRRVLRALLDGGEFLELRPGVGRSLICALGRIAGHSVGVLASQPLFDGGTLNHLTCDKAVRLLCMSEAFNLPVVSLVDTPGLMVGPQVEHERLLHRVTALLQAFAISTTPKLTVIVRKAFGLGYLAMGGAPSISHAVLAWPSAELSFMDPEVAANVLAPGATDDRAVRAAELSRDANPFGAAATMKIDEIIDPADTRRWLSELVAEEPRRQPLAHAQRALAAWPSGW